MLRLLEEAERAQVVKMEINGKSELKTLFYEVVDGSNIQRFPLIGELCINAHDHGCVRVAHPLLQGLNRDAGVIAHCTERDPEIMALYVYGMPGRERLSFLYKCFMLFRLSVPAAIAAVELRFKEEDIGLIFPCEACQGHHGTVFLVA